MRKEELTVIFRKGTLDAKNTLVRAISVLKQHGVPMSGFLLYGRQVDIDELVQKSDKGYRTSFNIEGQGFQFHLSSVGNSNLDLFAVMAEAPTGISWDEWANAFIAVPNFVMGWTVDVEYDHWQNAKDPLEYTAVHRPYSHLPMTSNGLPPPLEQQIIDTSHNPGRRLFREGYVEAVGAIMWLGAPFWSSVGSNKLQVEATSWLDVSHPTPSVTRIQSSDRCFTRDEGEGRTVQTNLRRLLFPAQGE